MDTDKDGYIVKAVYYNKIGSIPPEIKEKMWDRCKFWKFDIDKDGKVLFEEWKSFGLNNKPWFWLHIYKYITFHKYFFHNSTQQTNNLTSNK